MILFVHKRTPLICPSIHAPIPLFTDRGAHLRDNSNKAWMFTVIEPFHVNKDLTRQPTEPAYMHVMLLCDQARCNARVHLASTCTHTVGPLYKFDKQVRPPFPLPTRQSDPLPYNARPPRGSNTGIRKPTRHYYPTFRKIQLYNSFLFVVVLKHLIHIAQLLIAR